MAYVYTLNLKGGKKYVGMTENPEKRLNQHFSGNGAKWTQKHEPVSINSIQKVKNIEYAKRLETIVYHKMKNYHGIENVRGAGYTKSIDTYQKKSYGECYRCGRRSHWASDCYAGTDINGNYLYD